LDAWLAADGVRNLRRINACLDAATSWETK
jgi:hypothetical protein